MFSLPYVFLFILFLFISLFRFCLNDDEFVKIFYAQDKTQLRYYTSAHNIDKKYLFKFVAQPIMQELTVTVEVKGNIASNIGKVLVLPKKRIFMKIAGDWTEYPKDQYDKICLAFVHKKDLVMNDTITCPDDIFNSHNNVNKFCYKKNEYSINNLFLYIELYPIFFETLFLTYNIPVVVNTEHTILYFTNNVNNGKYEKEILDLHVCYKSNEESVFYLGNVVFNSYFVNIQTQNNTYDVIYTHSFFSSNWDYSIYVKGDYMTTYNRLAFIEKSNDFESNRVTINGTRSNRNNIFRNHNNGYGDLEQICPPFWSYATLGAGALNKLKNDSDGNKIKPSTVQYFFSNENTITDYYIPYIQNATVLTNKNYFICLYSDENDYEGMYLSTVHFSVNAKDTLIFIFLFFFIIIFLPLILSLTCLCIIFKIDSLNLNLKKLKLQSRKDEIEDRLKRELDLSHQDSA
ncbi:conserved protein, unknown function [Hepatocystis sp. ex Piliocolobus tephrosceles]|nr:conserved protein, unknown function [Hepatocystis sp. ex Piliocolobus tephrosceles]